jgi:transcriptional regulator with XRE-family HTH domain
MSFIGNALTRERIACKMTQKQLAEITDFSPQFINDVEHGRRIPAPETVLRFANMFPESVDSAWWLWLALYDTWGPEIAAAMRRFAAAEAHGDWPEDA